MRTIKTEAKKKRIVVIGGGTGIFPVLTGLKEEAELAAIVTMSEDGGSTGILREEFGILPPGDIRRALIALASSDQTTLSKLFSYRFREGKGLVGHSFGNLMLTAMERITGDFGKAIEEVSKMLRVQGRVIPATMHEMRLVAELENGKIIKGETNVAFPRHDGRLRIKRVWLDPEVSANPEAVQVINDADGIILGPGDPYTAIIPNLLVRGIPEAIAKSKATTIYFVNLLTKFGETNNFQASDFLHVIETYLEKETIDYVIVNKTRPSLMRMKPYLLEKVDFVKADIKNLGAKPVPVVADLLRRKGLVRHDPEKIKKIIFSLI